MRPRKANQYCKWFRWNENVKWKSVAKGFNLMQLTAKTFSKISQNNRNDKKLKRNWKSNQPSLSAQTPTADSDHPLSSSHAAPLLALLAAYWHPMSVAPITGKRERKNVIKSELARSRATRCNLWWHIGHPTTHALLNFHPNCVLVYSPIKRTSNDDDSRM